MKTLTTLVLLSFLSVPALAAGPVKVFNCTGQSDPDASHVDIYTLGDRVLAHVQQMSGDGDDYAEDVIEVRKVNVGDGTILTLKQVNGSQPWLPKVKSSRRTRDAVIQISLRTLDGTIQDGTGPTGSDLMEQYLECTRVK